MRHFLKCDIDIVFITILLQQQLLTLQICGSTHKLAWAICGGWKLE